MFSQRQLFSMLVVAFMVLVIISDVADAKKCKAKKHKKTSSSSSSTSTQELAASGNASTTVKTVKSNGKSPFRSKAGISGGQALKFLASEIGWWNNWEPSPDQADITKANDLTAVSMLWGLGRQSHDNDAARFAAFTKLKPGSFPAVAYLNEFDFKGVGSSGLISVQDALAGWEKYIVPWRAAGSFLIGPSCAMQLAEKLCTTFYKQAKTTPDAVNVHIFQQTVAGVKKVVEHYTEIGLPLLITELACISYEVSPAVYCSQSEINAWWPQVIEYLENNDNVMGYAISDAANGPYASLTNNMQSLTTTGNLVKTALRATMKKRALTVDSGNKFERRRR